ncbi:MAG: response regulator [Hyphomicrobiaceae bacterium]
MRHCLVVDDSDVIRRVTKRILEDFNMTSTEAESADEGMALCQRAMPDLILLDWHMPSMAPIDFISWVRSQGGEQPYIFYCTTENDSEDLSQAFAAGADDFLMKPYDRDSLLRKLQGAGFT